MTPLPSRASGSASGTRRAPTRPTRTPTSPRSMSSRCFPYPSGEPAHGPRAATTPSATRRRASRPACSGYRRPAPHRVRRLRPARRERRHQAQHRKPSGVDACQNIDNARATDEAPGLLLRLRPPRARTSRRAQYYTWGQRIFLQAVLEKGLAYRKPASPVNWCPSCNTVLANEQVVEGRCWRCDPVPEKRELSQWYLKITDYAQELLDDLAKLSGWPENVKAQQRNWIGRSEGSEIDFTLADKDGVTPTDRKITVFTTRADTLFGVSFFRAFRPTARLPPSSLPAPSARPRSSRLKEATEKVSSVDRQGSAREKHGWRSRAATLSTPSTAGPPRSGSQITPSWTTAQVLQVERSRIGLTLAIRNVERRWRSYSMWR